LALVAPAGGVTVAALHDPPPLDVAMIGCSTLLTLVSYQPTAVHPLARHDTETSAASSGLALGCTSVLGNETVAAVIAVAVDPESRIGPAIGAVPVPWLYPTPLHKLALLHDTDT
jgi:hypothetical protein